MKAILICLVSVTLLACCSTARMPVPAPLGASERMAVSGRQGWKIGEQLAFGPYRTHSMNRSWTRGRDLEVAFYEGNRRRQTFSFVLSEGGADALRVECAGALHLRTLHSDVVDVSLRNASKFDCLLEDLQVERDSDWVLSMAERGEQPLEGELVSGDEVYEIEGTRKLDGALPLDETSGYYIKAGGEMIAAVEVVNNGAVWIDADTSREQRRLLSAAAASLLLMEELRATARD